jgi:trans-aconitate methyltransferase
MSIPVIEPSISPIDGYPKLARYIQTYPECAIYRRFGSLNSQNLLYFQADLTHLEQKLRQLELLILHLQRGTVLIIQKVGIG